MVEVEVTGVGRLTNTVAECPAPSHQVGHQAQHDTDNILRVAYGGDWWAERDAEKGRRLGRGRHRRVPFVSRSS